MRPAGKVELHLHLDCRCNAAALDAAFAPEAVKRRVAGRLGLEGAGP
jgi:hypothetical protein